MSGSIGGYSWGDLGNSISSLFGGSTSSGLDPSTFPVPPIPPTGSQSYPGGPAYDPTAASPASWAPTADISNADVAKALGALGGGAKGAAAKTPSGSGSQGGGMNMAQSQAVRGGGAAGLDALVRMLNARRDALLPQPVGISASAQQRPTAGLLGF